MSHFTIEVTGHGALEVASARGREALNELFCHEVDVLVPPRDAPNHGWVGADARIGLEQGGHHQTIAGIVTRVTCVGYRERPVIRAQYRLTIEPYAAVLAHRRRSRIFQHLRVHDIVNRVLAEIGIGVRWDLRQTYPKREYCTQYEESDLDFVMRILAEHGILFTIENAGLASLPGAMSEVWVCADDAEAYPSLDEDAGAVLQRFVRAGGSAASEAIAEAGGEALADAVGHAMSAASSLVPNSAPIPYRPRGDAMQTTAEAILAISDRLSMRPTRTTYRDFDPHRPLMRLETSTEESGPRGGGAPREVYDHHGRELVPPWEYLKGEAGRMMRSERRDAQVVSGETNSGRFRPGRRVKLEGHPLPHFNRELALIAIEYEYVEALRDGMPTGMSLRGRFEAVPANVTYVPVRPRRAVVQSLETATVVGPGSEEIHANGHAMVKVQFHWDREGERDDQSSCWIRTMQSWSGVGWGTQFMPRVGCEVVVAFEGGDADRPIVLGGVYNGIQPTPFPLPARREVSGVVTRSTPHGNRGHELSLDDTAGAERFRLRSSRDMDVEVAHDRRVEVTHDDKTLVQGDRSVETRGHSRQHAHASWSATSEAVNVTATATLTTRVAGSAKLQAGELVEQVDGDAVRRTEGHQVLLAGTEEELRSLQLMVAGDGRFEASRHLTLTAKDTLTLQVGPSQIRLTEEGIELLAPKVTIQGEGSLATLGDGDMSLVAEGTLQGVADTVLMQSSGAAMGLTSEAALQGAKVLLNSPAQAEDAIETSEREPTQIELRDEDGQPLAYQRFVIRLADGSERTGMLDRNGKATVALEASAKIRFPGLTDVEPA